MGDDKGEVAGLKPCPFCGSETAHHTSGLYEWISCGECMAEGPTAKSATNAAKFWNARALPSNAGQCEVEKLRRVVLDLEHTIVGLFTSIARGDQDAGERFASKEPSIIAARATLKEPDQC